MGKKKERAEWDGKMMRQTIALPIPNMLPLWQGM